jgi:hypothetical protein
MSVQAADRRLIAGGVVAIAGSALALIGVLLPWQNGSGSAPAQMGFDYSSGPFPDGPMFILLAGLSILATAAQLFEDRLPEGLTSTILRMLGSGAGFSVLSGLFIACFGILNLRDIGEVVDAANSAVPGITSVGPGIYLAIAGGMVMIAGGGVGLLLNRRQ